MKAIKTQKKKISISLPVDMIELLKKKATIDKRTISGEIEYLLEDRLMNDQDLPDLTIATMSGFADDLNDSDEDNAWAIFK